MSLVKWVEYGWLRPEATSPSEIKDLLGIVDRGLTDSKVPTISADLRFIAAFSAALTAATTALRACGYRTATQRVPSRCGSKETSRVARRTSGSTSCSPTASSAASRSHPDPPRPVGLDHFDSIRPTGLVAVASALWAVCQAAASRPSWLRRYAQVSHWIASTRSGFSSVVSATS